MTPAERRNHVRKMKIKASALRRHANAKDPLTGKSFLAQTAGRASALQREGDSAWGVSMAIRRWHPDG